MSASTGPRKTENIDTSTLATTIQDASVGSVAQGPYATSTNIVVNRRMQYVDVVAAVDERVRMALADLREAVGQARSRSSEDMTRSSCRSFAAVQAIAEPDATSVAEFFQRAGEAPAFPARAARLFQEGVKTPTEERRQLLAAALFGVPAETPERERIDAALERLFPADIYLLLRLVRFSLPYLLLVEAPDGDLFIVREESRGKMLWKQALPEPQLRCNSRSLHNLQANGCIQRDNATKGLGPEGRYLLASLFILPLGRPVINDLERAGMLAG